MPPACARCVGASASTLHWLYNRRSTCYCDADDSGYTGLFADAPAMPAVRLPRLELYASKTDAVRCKRRAVFLNGPPTRLST